MPGRCRQTVYELTHRSTIHLLPGCARGHAKGYEMGDLVMTRLAEIPPEQRQWCGRCSHRS